MKYLLFSLCLFLSGPPVVRATDFTVVAYNVENLFDLDGVSLFGDYAMSEDEGSYSREKLLTKLQTIGRVLQSVDGGRGPDLILFQEFEADFTPDSTVTDYAEFLRRYRNLSTADMLGTKWRPEFSGIPVEAWLLKQLSDLGIGGYEIAVAPAKSTDSGIAHSNAAFSRFPIRELRLHKMPEARDLLELRLDVDGRALVVFCNHWKSGASDPEREAIRVRDARVLRGRIDTLLKADPFADIIVGGDLNSNYNQSLLYPEIKTGIGDVLRSQGDEAAIQKTGGPDLYNLWFELPPEARFSEIWRGRKGTLMHLILSRGLYDDYGISYVDGSFHTLVVPEVNADGWGRPVRWSFLGRSGGGASDHLPLIARFRAGSGSRPGKFPKLRNPSDGTEAPDFEYGFNYGKAAPANLPGASELATTLDAGETGRAVGRLFSLETRVTSRNPLEIGIMGRRYPVYVPERALFHKLRKLPEGSRLRIVGELNLWNGELQWIVYRVVD